MGEIPEVSVSTPPSVNRKKTLRAKIRRQSGKIEAAMEELYKPVEEWDMEELARGRPRNSLGTFAGTTPRWISPAVRDEAKRRLQTLGRSQLHSQLEAAVNVIARLATDEDVDDDGKPVVPASVRLSAAQFIVEQTLGKATAKVEIDAGESLQSMLAGSLVLPGGVGATVIEGELAEEDEDEA